MTRMSQSMLAKFIVPPMSLEQQEKIYRERCLPENYDEGYNNVCSHREDARVRQFLADNLVAGLPVLDLGCGTGFGYEILGQPADYRGVDINAGYVEIARSKFQADFNVGSAEEVVRSSKKLGNVIALWSLNYMEPSIIYDIHQRSEGVFVAVHLNKPYIETSASHWYRGLKELFEAKHSVRQEEIAGIFTQLRAKTYKLLDEPYYYVTIMRGMKYGS